MPDRADNDVWGVLFETEAPRLSAKALRVIGQGLRDLYRPILEEVPSDRLGELIAALSEAEPASKGRAPDSYGQDGPSGSAAG